MNQIDSTFRGEKIVWSVSGPCSSIVLRNSYRIDWSASIDVGVCRETFSI